MAKKEKDDVVLYQFRHTLLLAKGHYISTGDLFRDIKAVAAADSYLKRTSDESGSPRYEPIIKTKQDAVNYLAMVAVEVSLAGDDFVGEYKTNISFLYQYGQAMLDKPGDIRKDYFDELIMTMLLAVCMRFNMSDLVNGEAKPIVLGEPDVSVLRCTDPGKEVDFFRNPDLFKKKVR